MKSFEDQNSNSKFLFCKNFEDSIFKHKLDNPMFVYSNGFQNYSRTLKDLQPIAYESNRIYSNPYGLQQPHQPAHIPAAEIKEQDEQADQDQDSKKGLRFLALRVSDLLKRLVSATYREVSGLLVEELVPQALSHTSKIKEEKNIKRRVYDALNVLISVGVIEKKSKKISIREHTSVGKCLTSNNWDNIKTLQKCTDELSDRIQSKTKCLDTLLKKYIAMSKLHRRNRQHDRPEKVLMLPVIGLVTTGKEIKVHSKPSTLLICSTNKVQTKADLDLVKEIFKVEQHEIDTLVKSLGWDI